MRVYSEYKIHIIRIKTLLALSSSLQKQQNECFRKDCGLVFVAVLSASVCYLHI